MKSLVLGLAVLASAGAVQAMPPAAAPAAYIPAPPPPTGLVTIYDNIARKYPKGLYNEVAGRAITGTSNPIGFPQVWIATAFTPATSHALKRVQLGLTRGAGTNSGVVAIYDDNAGVPGTALKTWHVMGMQDYGTCCSLVVRNATGVQLTGGQQYWLVVKTDASSQDSYLSWNYNTVDQITHLPAAVYCKDANGVTCAGTSGVWSPTALAPTMAFAVYGD